MKPIIVTLLFFVILGVNSRHMNDDADLEPEEEECVAKLKLSRGWIKMLNNQETTTEENEKYNEFVACLWEKKGFQDANGNVNFNGIKTVLREAFENDDKNASDQEIEEMLLEALLEGCKTLKGNNFGHTAVKIQNCMSKNLAKLQKSFN